MNISPHKAKRFFQPENAGVVRIGVGSHNLFDVALALVLGRKYGVEDT